MAGRPVPIPRLLSDLVKAALDAAAYTGGAVDPTVGLAMHRIGYDRDIAAIPQHGPAITPSSAGRSWPDVRLHREAGLLTVPMGTALDLGATAKAYTVDHAARTLYNRYGVGVLVEIGGDLATAGVAPPGGRCTSPNAKAGRTGRRALSRRHGDVHDDGAALAPRRPGRPPHRRPANR